MGRQLKPVTAGAGHCEVPFAGSPLTAESPEGDFVPLAATSVAGQPGDAQHAIHHRQPWLAGMIFRLPSTIDNGSPNGYLLRLEVDILDVDHVVRR